VTRPSVVPGVVSAILGAMPFVDFQAALAAPGLRLVVAANVPSPWSEAALAIFRVKKLPFVATRARAADAAF
jgi:hypothetical protein